MNIKACDLGQVAVYQKDIASSIEGVIVFAAINNFAVAKNAMQCLGHTCGSKERSR